MLVALYLTKAKLKGSIGQRFRYQETSMLEPEAKPNIMLTVVGPSAYERKWYAQVWLDDSLKVVSVK